MVVTLPATTKHVGELLSGTLVEEPLDASAYSWCC